MSRGGNPVVVLAFCLSNDFAEAVLPVALYDGRTPKPHYELVDEELVLDSSNLRRTGLERLLLWLSDNSLLVNRASALGSVPPVTQHWRDRKREAQRDGEYAIRLCVRIVRRMDAACRERGVAFVLAAFPSRFSYSACNFTKRLQNGPTGSPANTSCSIARWVCQPPLTLILSLRPGSLRWARPGARLPQVDFRGRTGYSPRRRWGIVQRQDSRL